MNFFNRPVNQVINLYGEQRKDFLYCFEKNKYSLRTIRHKLIKYVKMFYKNQMDYSLFEDLITIKSWYHIFKFKPIKINDKIYIIFYIDNFLRLVKVEDIYEDEYTGYEFYNQVVDFNDYKLIYSVRNDLFNFDDESFYIQFMLCKDETVYIKNEYRYNEELKMTIKGTTDARVSNDRLVCNELGVKTPGVTREQLKNYFDSILVMNILKA